MALFKPLLPAIATLTLLVGFWVSGPGKVITTGSRLIGGIFGGGDKEVEVVDADILILGLKDIGILETTSSAVLVEIEVKEERPSILKDAVLRIVYSGNITAGIDFSKLDESAILVTDKAINIQIPQAQITHCFLEQSRILESSCGTNNPLYSECDNTMNRLHTAAYQTGLDGLLKVQDSSVVINQANESAKTQIANFVQALGYTDIELTVAVTETEIIPTCKP